MKYRSWWLGLLILILLAGVCVVLLRNRAEDPTGLPQRNLRGAGHNAEVTGPAARNPKRAHAVTITPLVTQFRKPKLPEVTDEQVARFLADNRRSPEALLAVFRIKGDLSLLREAAEAFPDHAVFQLELAMSGETTEEKQQALEAFRKLEPNNAMGDYLSALVYFEQGQPAEALEELADAESHPGFGERNPAEIQITEDIFRAAGYGLMEAKAAALVGQPRTQTMALNKLSGNLSSLHLQYTLADNAEADAEANAEAAQAVLQMGLALSRRLRAESRLLIDDFVGISMETRFLKQLPPEATVPGSGLTAASRLDALTAERLQISELSKEALEVLDGMNETAVLSYLKQLAQDGELKALHWLQQNHK